MTTLLETHALSIGYPPSVRVAADLHLNVPAGELVCLIGPNGTGKSTLMRTLAGMQPPLAGRVLLGGVDLHRLLPAERAKKLGIVLTERPNVGLLSGYGLVAIGRHPYSDWTGRLSRYDEAVIRWSVDAVGAGEFAARPVMELSDGQRQKLMIARALAQEPELILLDEPTAFLDLPRRVEVMQLLKYLTRETGCSVLLSTHELDLALRTADALWLMSDGVVRTGMPEDLILNGAFEAAFQSEGLVFNRETGAFSMPHPAGYAVAVSGHGVAHTWTCRALERAGYTLAHNGTAPDICIEITGENRWLLLSGDRQSTHTSLHDLLQALQQKA
jgi:iron complex transport system ATP-binding protein